MTAPAVLAPALDPAALRRARQATGLRAEDVGRLIGRAGTVVTRYETGEIDPPASVLGLLAGLYDVEVGTFFTQ